MSVTGVSTAARAAPLRGPAARLLARSLRGAGGPLRRIALWSVLEAGPALASGWALAAALDRGFLAGEPGTGLMWIGLLATLHVVRALAERALFDPLAACVEPMRDALVTAVVDATLSRAVRGAGAYDAAGVSRMTSQVDTVRLVVGALLRTARPLTVTLVATLVGLAALAPVLAAVVAVPLAAALIAFAVSMRSVIRRRRAAVVAEEDVAASTGAVLGAGRDIAALGAVALACGTTGRSARASARASVAVARAAAARVPIVLLGGQLPLLLILLAGPTLVEEGTVSAGEVVGASLYVTGSLVPALQLLTGTVAGLWGQLQVVLERLATATAPCGEPESGTVRGDGPSGHRIDVDNLTFSYGPHAEPVVRDVRLSVPEGDHLVIVGASGVGKSTLAGLLAGLERPSGGQILLGGRPVADLGARERPAAVALLPQEAYVFPGTLRDNLRYLAPDAGTAAVAASIAAMGLEPVVERLGGVDAVLDDPAAELSSGERQLVAAARTWLSAAPVVLLDEATCHLDMRSEAVVEAAFAARPGTLVVIAHRLASALRGRRVLLLDGTRAVCGTHAELLAAEPGYAALVGHWDGTAPPAGRPGPSAVPGE
ncbi:ATP-binding cassette domain-containing protein [Streptomyces sp. NPDC088258]|uniref:ATP-binding cassette domain-containing protein n=1 Tax=Streptomyces sp. NPDC088258 TaxID=3365849 RepID=UPI00382F4522